MTTSVSGTRKSEDRGKDE